MNHRHLVFHAWQSQTWLVCCTAAAITAIVLIVLLLRYERGLVPRRVGNTLLVLRLAVVVVLLLTWLEPVLTWTVTRERSGRIVVSLDLSDSMSTTDTHATSAEKLRWARSLNMIGNSAINERLDRWIAAWEQGGEPQWIDESETDDPQRLAQLTDVRKRAVGGILSEIDRLSRKEIASRLLTGTSTPLIDELKRLGRVDLRLFSREGQSVDETTLLSQITAPPEGLSSDVTNLGAGMRDPASNSESSPLIGVVLLTDGRDNSGNDPVALARRLGDASVPVVPILIGSEFRPKDLSIGDLDYPSTAFKGDRPVLNAIVNTFGFESESVTVTLERAGDEANSQTCQIVANGQPAAVKFELDAAEAGHYQYTLRTDVRPDETREDNNERRFAMSVVDDRARVLVLDGEARWEFRFIDNALERDERVDVKRVVFEQPYLGVLPQTFFPNRLTVPSDSDDLLDSPFADLDMLIIGDVRPSDLSRTAWELIDKFVSESGGTVVFVAGKRYLPLAYRSDVVDRLVPLTGLHPVSIGGGSAKTSPEQRGFHLRVTPEGENEVFLQLAVDREENRTIWKNLPRHMWGLLGQAKPSATVLAYAVGGDESNVVRGGDRNTLEEERRNAVVVHQHYGFGQVLWIGIDSTWRWRHRVGDTYHHRFWGQLARWAAETRATAGNESVKFGPDRTDVATDEPVVIRARWSHQFLRRFPELKAKAEVRRDGDVAKPEPIAMIDLQPVESRPLVYEGRVASLPRGEYRVKLTVENADAGRDEIVAPLNVHERLTPELNDLSCNRELLAQIADVSGGRLIFPDEIDQIASVFSDAVTSETQNSEIPLWDHWVILVVFFTLLTTEWIVRKLNGLP